MKKILLILFFAAFALKGFSNFNQGNWRWYKDDAKEATAIKPEKKAPQISNYDNIRLRIQIFNDGAGDLTDKGDISLQYSADSSTWVNITTDAANAFVLSPSAYVNDGDATTALLTPWDASYTFVPGKYITTTTVVNNVSLPSNSETEYEYCIKPTAAAMSAATYYFRMWPADESGFYYSPIPSLTTSATLPVSISRFTVSKENEYAKIEWTTASETNNKYFNVLRSADGKTNWQTIATVNGKGTSTSANNYMVYDKTPLNGNNFYKIHQVDFDGKFAETNVQSLLMQLIQSGKLSVYPNPVKGANVTFTTSTYSGKLTAFITNLKGAVLHQEILNSASGQYQLHLTTALKAGVYILKISGDNYSATAKLVAE